MISFGSDNHSGVHPKILSALETANSGHAPSYGTDLWTEQAIEKLKNEFGQDSVVQFVFNGTAANVVALSTLLKSFESVICAETSHLHQDECGAPEKHLGSKLLTVPTENSKITVDQIDRHLVRKGDQHFSQARVVSITQVTEYGTCYDLSELKALRAFCDKNELYLHIDGSRLIYAATFLKCSLLEAAGFADAISFGGTKNGLLFGEAVIIRTPELAKNLKYLRKQLMQLPSKQRFLSSQFLALFSHDSSETPLWREIGSHAHACALRLAEGLSSVPEVQVTQEVQANSVFAVFPRSWTQSLREQNFFYIWNEKTWEARLMTSFDTSFDQIDQFIAKVRKMRA